MSDSIDWKSTTWRANRRRQHQEFYALSFREKMRVIEEMAEVAERLRRIRVQEKGGDGGDREMG